MYYDYHIHTYYSDDSNYPMENVVKDAINLGIEEICFSDHVDYGIKYDWIDNCPQKDKIMNVNYPEYLKEINYLQKKYKDKISIKKGLEFGIQTSTINKYRDLFKKYSFDFIIMSCHQVDNLEFWTQDYQNGKSQQEYNEGYYNEILNVIREYKEYSVLGHLDHIIRYDKNGEYPFDKIKGIITEILKLVIKDGKGIEINTSSYRYNLRSTTPSIEILKLYKELGGTIVTVGSDSHKPEHLGKYIKETYELLKELGFEYICTFENMKPIYHKL